jgi:23S rRNA pseudouridine1911/1915/1917 synthase
VVSATVDDAAAGSRLDQFVARLLAASVHEARRLIEEGRVTLDGRGAKSVKKGLRLIAGQRIAVASLEGDAAAAVLAQPDLPLAILYSDAHVVAVNKAAGVATHPLRPGETGTLANALVARFPDCALAGADPREAGLGHRLDNVTSGVLLAARSHDVWLGLRAALKAPGCEKTYLAEVVGHPAPRGSLSQPIGRRGRRGAQVVVGDQGRHPLSAVTNWETLEERPATTLIRVRLHAGRAHQVRAHLAAAGYPLVGDGLYGPAPAPQTAPPPDSEPVVGAQRLRLHAESVRLQHPVLAEVLFVEAPPPRWANISQEPSQEPSLRREDGK